MNSLPSKLIIHMPIRTWKATGISVDYFFVDQPHHPQSVASSAPEESFEMISTRPRAPTVQLRTGGDGGCVVVLVQSACAYVLREKIPAQWMYTPSKYDESHRASTMASSQSLLDP